MPELLQDATDSPALGLAIQKSQRVLFLAQQEVVFNTEIGGQVEFLVDHGHAGDSTLMGIGWCVWLSRQFHSSGIGTVSPAENFHERTLAGPILADQCEDFAGMDFQRNILQGQGRAEAFADAVHGK